MYMRIYLAHVYYLSVTASNAATHIKATGIASPAKMKQPVGVFDDDHQRDRRRPLWRP